MKCLTVKDLKSSLDLFDDDAFVSIVSVDNGCSFPPMTCVNICCGVASANDDMSGVYLYTDEAIELCERFSDEK